MARQRHYVPLNVYLSSRLVGQLRRDPAGAIAFQYDAGWLAWPHTLPVFLSLPLREAAYTGTPVLAVFESLLPDNGGLRRRIAARTQAEGTVA
jgi:serine/threonine-protein kinase HipA